MQDTMKVTVKTDLGPEVADELSRNDEMVTVRFADGTVSSWLVSRVTRKYAR